MEYDQFFTQEDTSCSCYPQIKLALIGISCVAILIDCVYSCSERNRLNKENKTLKNIISKSLERTIMRNLKNGYDIDDSDDQ